MNLIKSVAVPAGIRGREIDARGEVRLCFDGVVLKKGGLITIINNVSCEFFVRAVRLARFLGVFLCWRACWW